MPILLGHTGYNATLVGIQMEEMKTQLDIWIHDEISDKDRITQDPFTLLDSTFIHQPLTDQCQTYFNKVVRKTRYRNLDRPYYPDAYNKRRFYRPKIDTLLDLQALARNGTDWPLSEDALRSIMAEQMRQRRKYNNRSAVELSNRLKSIRMFGKCFLSDPLSLDDLCTSYSEKLFPYLKNRLPKYTKWIDNVPTAVSPFQTKLEGCLLGFLHQNLNNTGIVISMGDKLTPEMVALISVLRSSYNTLPLHLFHNGDLSESSQKMIVSAANSTSNFPPQDITFVDISPVVAARHLRVFTRFYNKLLALLLSSFEHMILLDTDTVPLIPVTEFFQLPNHVDHGGSFFRDRESSKLLRDGVVDHFRALMPTDHDSRLFGSSVVPEKALAENRMFDKSARHVMESGLLTLNKKTHFAGLLASAELPFHELTRANLHGEKEMIWLGQYFAGNVDWSFNRNGAAAVGELTTKSPHAQKICSTHPGHLSDEDDETLLWINSGFFKCKKNSEPDDLGYLKIRSALVPPPGHLLEDGGPDEPERGWETTDACDFYVWCAYDVIGGEGGTRGRVINYTNDEADRFDRLGQMWVRSYNEGLVSMGE